MTAWSSKRTTLIALKIAFSIGLIAFLL